MLVISFIIGYRIYTTIDVGKNILGRNLSLLIIITIRNANAGTLI